MDYNISVLGYVVCDGSFYESKNLCSLKIHPIPDTHSLVMMFLKVFSHRTR